MSSSLDNLIERVLPHRHSFLLVDRVTEFEPGRRIAGVKNFSANEDACQGYDPARMLVPAGVLFEMVTQLGAILVLARPEMQGPEVQRPGMQRKVAVILQISIARLLEPVYLGDTLRLEAEAVKLRENFGELRGAAYRDGELVAEGQMRFAIANGADLLPE
jgi:3-hydroxymyristoyl/3-hydroxydecanoyl-(acyl carrier protein) dehydratase